MDATLAPLPHRSAADAAPKRSRKKLLTKVDRRSVLGKRIAELTAIFATAVGGECSELTPIRKAALDRAAELTAIAEKARGDFMREGAVSLNQVTRAERNATQARHEIGLADVTAASQRGGPDLYEQLGMSR